MSYPYIVFGDVSAAVISLLEDDSALSDMDPIPTFTKNMIGFTEKSRWVTVTPEGGFDSWGKEESRIDFDCYAEDINAANDIARYVKAAVMAAQGSKLADNVYLLKVSTDIGLTQLQDKETETPRYLLSLRLTIAQTKPA